MKIMFLGALTFVILFLLGILAGNIGARMSDEAIVLLCGVVLFLIGAPIAMYLLLGRPKRVRVPRVEIVAEADVPRLEAGR